MSARSLAVQIVSPAGELATFAGAEALLTASAAPAPFAHPADGSVVAIEMASAAAAGEPIERTASAVSEAVRVSLFAGEVTADSVRGAVAGSGVAGNLAGSAVENLTVLGASVVVAPNLRVPLADWGYAVVLSESTRVGPPEAPSFQASVTGLLVHLDADHGGLVAGSEIRIGFAEISTRLPLSEPGGISVSPATTAAEPDSEPPPTTAPEPDSALPAPAKLAAAKRTPKVQPTAAAPRPVVLPRPKAAQPRPRQPRPPLPIVPSPLALLPPSVMPRLTASRYVFPVYGPSAHGDTFGAPRSDVSGGWHHGDDIFAPLGAPLLAVADGTVFSVGWNDIGGYRLWLRDTEGNEFYYAHLSAFTTLAVNGARVRAGDVLGFVGNSGDAIGTPYHLHFEVHPVSLLFLGYDGAVNPTRYLDAWRRLEDVTIRSAVGFALPVAPASKVPTPGAILLESSDISTASGLDPGALRRALSAPRAVDLAGSRVGGLPVPPPVLDRG